MVWPTGHQSGTNGTPARTSRKHRDHNRAHWKAKRLPCARRGCTIDYDGPYRLPDGTRNPRYLVVGHIVGVKKALELGWTLDQINDLSNTQPECLQCSHDSGSDEGLRARGKTPRNTAQEAAPEAAYW